MSQAAGRTRGVASKPEVDGTLGEIVGVAQEWLRAHAIWQQAVYRKTQVAVRSESLLRDATGGLSVARWEAVCRRRSIRRVVDAQAKARALRAGPKVAEALARRDRLIAAADAEMLAARVELAVKSTKLSAYGAVGARLVGLDIAALRRFARLPPESRRSQAKADVGSD